MHELRAYRVKLSFSNMLFFSLIRVLQAHIYSSYVSVKYPKWLYQNCSEYDKKRPKIYFEIELP